MTYRDETAPLDELHQNLRQALDENRARSSALTAEAAAIHHELAAVHTRLEVARRTRRRLPLAKTLVASPCDVPWAAMTGDDRMRFCKSCEKHVHNLSAMTTTEIEAFLGANADGNACVNLYQRVDGTILTADCPVGMKRRRLRALRLSSLGAGACALFAFTAFALTLAAMHTTDAPAQQPQVQIVEVPGPIVQVAGPSVPVPTLPEGYTKLPAAPYGMGWILIHGPDGTRVFEGKRLLGVTPLVLTLPAGRHSLRAEGTTNDKKWSEGASVIDLPNAGTADVNFHGPVARLRMGGVMPAPTTNDPLDF